MNNNNLFRKGDASEVHQGRTICRFVISDFKALSNGKQNVCMFIQTVYKREHYAIRY